MDTDPHTPPKTPNSMLSPPRTPSRSLNSNPSHPNTTRPPATKQWPQLPKTLATSELVNATERIFGYKPRQWQTEATIKILEGHDTFVLAPTGAGKSLVFAMLAVAAELTGSQGLVVVICPLKALQLDQVCASFCRR